MIYNSLNGIGDAVVDNRKRKAMLEQQAYENQFGQRKYSDALMQDERDFGFRQSEAERAQKNADREYGLSREKLAKGGDGSGHFYGVPIPFRRPDGSIAYGLPSKDGGFRELQPGEGNSFVGPYDKAAMTASGKDTGEAIAEYRRMSTKMPGLEKVITQLGEVGNKATYTLGGRAVDEVNRQLGLSPREEAVARTQYIAMVDNQILPLLRDTFGAQFTVTEGDSLRATLGDPNKSPQEKQAVLTAFIEQKRRNVEAAAMLANQGEYGAQPQGGPQGAPAMEDPLGIR